ncbi:MAG TPA: SDR family NAD(P)-dependent oxidoreductase [Solirubrobacteraceae bacterium]|nr:SDR family NAD(P)-dependent oxidoreductase [Solirubrobacteraceae bacterium]
MDDQAGRRFLVTGATGGIGLETARSLASNGATVYITARSADKGRRALDELATTTGSQRLHALELELGELDSVRGCAAAFLATGEPLHGLINNAGLAGSRGMTPSGFELAFGTNHVGTFLLTELLTERLAQSAPARVVNVASVGHYQAKGIDFEAVRRPTRTRTAFPEYCVSKLANVLHAAELGRRLQGTGVTTYSLHPGTVATDVWRRVPWPIRPLMLRRMDSPQEGARTSLYCATAPELGDVSGHYYDSCAEKTSAKTVTPQLAAELWERSAEWVGRDA